MMTFPRSLFLVAAVAAPSSPSVVVLACPPGGGDKCAFDPFNPHYCGKGTALSCMYDTICDVKAAGFNLATECCQAPQPSACTMNYDPQICGTKKCPYDNLCIAKLAGYSESQCKSANPPTPTPPDECYPERPRPVRNGERFRFNLNKKDAQCVDSKGRKHQSGEFERVAGGGSNLGGTGGYGGCADYCVHTTDQRLLDQLRGYDFSCRNGLCRCLYDAGALADNDRSGGRDPFFRTNRNAAGDGSITDEVNSSGFACYKRVGAEMVVDLENLEDFEEEEFEVERSFMRGRV